jgi:poly-gamma-glutamate capsule biosynthesis protein CapA/YwtB (metallophosphatase superfamily)
MLTLALAGDTMLGRKVGERLEQQGPSGLVADEVAGLAREADLFLLNLECCISTRGEPWPDPAKPFFFRAPPIAVEVLRELGVDVVTLANNHALDFGPVALLDTLEHLAAAGIAAVGAGRDAAAARRTVTLDAGGIRVRVVGVTDHPVDYAATESGPGVAYADVGRGVPGWLADAVAGEDADVVVVTPHWGPNMVPSPVPGVRRAADALVAAGADLIAGHSAHVFHGVRFAPETPAVVLYDLGDFLDDYATHPQLRNDLGLLWLVTLDGAVPVAVEAVPLRLRYTRTELAEGEHRAWIVARLRTACAPLGTTVVDAGDRLRLSPD